MKSIKNIEDVIIINKSKFITNLFYIESTVDVDKYLNEIKNKYRDATHHCYAYILNNIKRFNDDGEPNGTAGMPILKVLEKQDINYVLCIVTRYFGGIKLGAGGLLRAYTSSITNAINNTKIVNIENGYLVSINFSYDKEKTINKLLNEFEIVNKIFDSIIKYEVIINKDTLDKLRELHIDVEVKKEIVIKK